MTAASGRSRVAALARWRRSWPPRSSSAGAAPASVASPTTPPDADAVPVVATTTVLADLVKQVGGARVDVHSLVPKGGEVHTFDPTPADVERITRARLVVAQRPRAGRLAARRSSRTPARRRAVVALGEDLDGRDLPPGAWRRRDAQPACLDERRDTPSRYVDRIEQALRRARPGGCGGVRGPGDGLPRVARSTSTRRSASGSSAIPADRTGRRLVPRRVPVLRRRLRPHARRHARRLRPGQDPSAGRDRRPHPPTCGRAAPRSIFAEAQFSDAARPGDRGRDGGDRRRRPVRRHPRRRAGRHVRRDDGAGTPTGSSRRCAAR